MLRQSVKSAIGWTAFRWRSNWPPPGCAPCRSRTIAARLQDRFRLLSRRRSYCITSPTDAARADRLESRPSNGWRTRPLSPVGRLCRRLDCEGRGGRVRRRSNRARGCSDLLAQLTDKSLVAMESESGRYALLETVRQYAQEKLVSSGEEAVDRAQHLAFHVDLAEKARQELLGPRQAEWLKRIDLDAENFLVCACILRARRTRGARWTAAGHCLEAIFPSARAVWPRPAPDGRSACPPRSADA